MATVAVRKEELTDRAEEALAELERATRDFAELASRGVVEIRDAEEYAKREELPDDPKKGLAREQWNTDYKLRALERYNDLDEAAIAELPESERLFEYLYTQVFEPRLLEDL